MGEDLTKEGKLEEARDYFEKAIRITEHPEPGLPALQRRLCACHQRLSPRGGDLASH